jgi:type VI secretion system secreted protein VgrG
MEEEGISYYFSHENGKHTLVLADATNAYSPCLHQDEVRYQVSGAGEKAEESMIKTLEIKNEIRVGKYSLNDYNFETPSTKLLVEMEGKHNQGPVKKGVYDYPGRYAKRAEGEGYATVHIQEEEARVTSITGSSDVKSFASGYSFTLVDYFRNEMNNKKYLLTAVDHVAEQQGLCSSCGDDSYTNSFTCIPLDTIFRPLRLTPKPVVEGVQTAFVVGPAGEEIYTDDHGRIKVQFHWDRLGKVNENSSCWMRVGQIWAGPGWGAMYIPRVGHEVIVDFLEGDPDRPIVIGSVYHGTNQPPYQLPAEKTKTTIKSSSSKGGGGFNEIRFEDKKDSEQLFVHAQKNFDLQVKNDRFETIGNDRHLHVTKNKMEHVENNRHEKVVNDHLEEIGKDRHLSVKGKEAKKVTQTLSLTVEGDVAEVFKANHSEQTTTDYYLKATNIVIEATTNVTVKVGQSYIAIEASGIKIGTTGQIVLEATNTVGIKGTAGVTVESPAQATLKSANTTVKGDAMVTVDGGAMTKVKGGMVMIN